MNAETCSGARPTNRRGFEDQYRSRRGERSIGRGSRSIRSLPTAPSLSRGRGRQRMDSDPLVQRLAIAAGLDGRHQEVLGRHERELGGHVPRDHRRVDHQARNDVQVQAHQGVDGQEHLRDDHPAHRGVVQGALQPLGRRRLGCRRPAEPSRTGRSNTSARPASGSACKPSPTTRPVRPRTAPRPRVHAPAAGGPSRTGAHSRPRRSARPSLARRSSANTSAPRPGRSPQTRMPGRPRRSSSSTRS